MNSSKTENININFNTVSTPNPPNQNNIPPSNNTTTNKDININASVLLYIFDKSNIILLIWFLAIYLLLYLVLGIFFKTDNINDTQLLVSRLFDLVILIITLVLFISTYYTLSKPEKENIIYSTGTSFKHTIDDPTTIYSLLLFIFAFYILIYSIGIPMTYSGKPISITIIETTVWILLTIIVIVNFLKYLLNINITNIVSQHTQYLYTLVSDYSNSYNNTSIGGNSAIISGNTVVSGNVSVSGNAIIPPSPPPDEVFNISNNLYTYDDARAICTSYDARLATYDDIEAAYDNGGEWCNYGWSDNQMIYFPTQKSTWDKLQQGDPKHKNNCGRPGINGGHIANPYVKFGVNCFGQKPKPSDADISRMKAHQNNIQPKNNNDVVLDRKVQFWKENSNKLLNINSFNNNTWSEY
jgi:hypothetical protein